jgi:hypothetical protein
MDEERKMCEAVCANKIKLMEEQCGRDREEVLRLNKELLNLQGQLETLEQRERKVQSEMRVGELRYLEKLQEDSAKQEQKMRNI